MTHGGLSGEHPTDRKPSIAFHPVAKIQGQIGYPLADGLPRGGLSRGTRRHEAFPQHEAIAVAGWAHAPDGAGLDAPVIRARLTGSPSPAGGSWADGDDPSRTQGEEAKDGATACARRAAKVRRALRSRAPRAFAPRRLRGCRRPKGTVEQIGARRAPVPDEARKEFSAMSERVAEIERLKAEVNCAVLLGRLTPS